MSDEGIQPADHERRLDEAVAAYLLAVEAGRAHDRQEWLARYPDVARELERFFAGIERVDRLAAPLRLLAPAVSGLSDGDRADGLGQLGDFHLLREVGRGGMGVVYEAEQISLGRRVALKVLPFAATMDRRQLQRFHNEARAAAGLHHNHIVPVHAVGEERGVHYYAMQFIHGQTLAAMIADMRRQGDRAPLPEAQATTPHVPGAPAAATVERGAASTERSPRDPAYFRQVAEWGIQGAEALDYAHGVGIIHRDVKPANLLVDDSGRLWVTDFGLAQVKSDARLTMTGDLVGTLRYMSPEQALAKRVIVDHRTDVYSLGATLYELLTLRPVFEGADRQELLRQIAFEDPRRPRSWNRAIPQELETIVLKAMERNPVDRYATAQELADDLQRFLQDKPIRARRPTVRQRLGRWGRRHPGWTAALGLAAGLLLAVAWAWDREKTQADTTARTVAAEADQLRDADRLPEALLAAQRAADLLPRFGDASLRRAIKERVADLQLVNRLEEARLEVVAERAEDKEIAGRLPRRTTRGSWVMAERAEDTEIAFQRAASLFRQAFQDYGVDVTGEDDAAIAEGLRHSAIAAQIAVGLRSWGAFTRDSKERERLNRLADALDPDPLQFVSRFNRAAGSKDVQALKRLAVEAEANLPLPMTLAVIGNVLGSVSCFTEAERLLRAGQQRYPADFWINHDLASILRQMGPVQAAEAIRFMSAALALRPFSPYVWLQMAYMLQSAGRLEEAIAAFHGAIALMPNYAVAWVNLGNALAAQGKMAEAEEAFRKAIQLEPKVAEAHGNLGNALAAQGRMAEAKAAYRKAIELKLDFAMAYYNLGNALAAQGRMAEAEGAYCKTIELKPNVAEAYGNLGNALASQGKMAEAVAAYRKAIELKPDSTDYSNLGGALAAQDKLDEAIAAFKEAISLKKDSVEAHWNLGQVLVRKGQFKQALQYLRLGHQLGSRDPRWRNPHAQWIREAERMAQLDDRLPAILDGKDKPKNANERLGFAALCQGHRQRFAAAVRFFEEALAGQPALASDLEAGHRYNAACAAALAGCGQGKDAAGLAEKERARLRKQALDWLRADLLARQKQLKSWWPGEADKARAALRHWQADPDFAGVRAPQALAKLPEAERPAWQKLWADVADTLVAAQRKAVLEKSDAKSTSPRQKESHPK